MLFLLMNSSQLKMLTRVKSSQKEHIPEISFNRLVTAAKTASKSTSLPKFANKRHTTEHITAT